MPERIIGIDWSGATDAGRRIYIAEGRLADGGLGLTALRRAEELPGAHRQRETCLPVLCAWLAAQGPCAVGLDFPFGLPRPLVDAPDWVSFVADFPVRFRSPEAFRDWCRDRSGRRELRRRTDIETRTPFAPYNLRLYRQTYWGITALLAPLVARGAAVALPMQPAAPGLPWLLEACPASLLKRLGEYTPYKGRGVRRRDARVHILETLRARERLHKPRKAIVERIVDDSGGDALDAVIAGLAAARAVEGGYRPVEDRSGDYAVEALVYW